MKKPKDDWVFVAHVWSEILDIEMFLKSSDRKGFGRDIKTQKAVVRSLEVMGEAVKNLSTGFRMRYDFVDWGGLAGLRDVIIHDYFDLRLDKIWEIIREELPVLKKQIKKILEEKNGE